MKTKKGLIILLLLALNNTFAQDVTDFLNKSDAFFKTHVTNGRVNYKAIKGDATSLDALLALAADVQVATSAPKTYQAFYINAYNLSVIKGIIANYPVKSPLDIKGFFDKKTYKLAGVNTTLNDLENKLLRKKFPAEPRFHFALVCGGLGCPPIISEAYMPNTLESQLQRQATLALNDASFIRVKGKKVQVSQIFEWYKGDFTQQGSMIDYINTYRKEPIPTNAKVSYYPYNWSLNITK